MLTSFIVPTMYQNNFPIHQAYAEDYSTFTNDELIEKLQTQITTLENMSKIIDETALVDISTQKLIVLKSKIVETVDNKSIQSNLLKKIDGILTHLEKADELIENSDEEGLNDLLKTTDNRLDAFINSIQAQQGKKINTELSDELIHYASEIISDLKKRDRSIIPLLQSYELPLTRYLFDLGEIELQILRDIFSEIENRDIEIEFSFQRNSPAIGVIILNGVKMTVSGADAWSVTSGVDDALKAADEPGLNDFEKTGLFLVNSAAFFGIDSIMPNPSEETAFVIELTKSIFGVVTNSDFIYDTYIPAFSEYLLAQQFLIGIERDLIIQIRNKNPFVPMLNVITSIINDNGGTKQSGDTTVRVISINADPPVFTGMNDPGVFVKLAAGEYDIIQDPLDGYDIEYTNDCSSYENGPIKPGQTRTCVITNDDSAPTNVFYEGFEDADLSDWDDRNCVANGTCVKGVSTSAHGNEPSGNYWGFIAHRDGSPGSCRTTDARQILHTFTVPETRDYVVSGTIVSVYNAKIVVDNNNLILQKTDGTTEPVSGSKTISLSAGTHKVQLVTEVGRSICHGLFPSYFDDITVK